MVLLLELGSISFIALGATSVEVSMKKIRSRKTRSDIEAVENSKLLLFFNLIGIGTVLE